MFAYYHWNGELGGDWTQKNKEKTRTISKSLRGIYIEEEKENRQIFFNLFIVAVLTAHSISICNTLILLFGDCVMYYCLTVAIDHVEIKT